MLDLVEMDENVQNREFSASSVLQCAVEALSDHLLQCPVLVTRHTLLVTP